MLGITLSVEAADRPNIVMIISDDHGWTDYGFMGHQVIQTPHLDRLASQSLVFKRGYVPSSLCCPSLATIITGLYPHQHKVTSNDPPIPAGLPNRQFQQSAAFKEGREVMNRHLEAVDTLPRLLGQHGYLSLQTGKWWQGHYSRGGFTHGMTTGQRHGDDGLKIGRQTMQPIYDFMATAKREQKPFFVWYAPLLPHDPHTPPQRLLDKYRDSTQSESVAKYRAMVEWFDETCGQLMTHLDEQGLTDNTIVVYVADNGWLQNENGNGFVRSKRSPYDMGLRTPIMIRWPKRIAPKMSDDLAMSIDLMPTLLAALNLPKSDQMPGLNLLDEQRVEARKELVGECFTHNAVDLHQPAKNLLQRWIVAGRWKLIVPQKVDSAELPAAQQNIELFDILADPHEKNDLAAAHPDVVRQLTAKLDSWWNPSGLK
jgi:uncharacterized sulfatase